MRIVVCGLTVSSSWGNGHATLWRGLIRALARQGADVTFFERDVPYYAEHRDLTALEAGTLVLYGSFDELMPSLTDELRRADVAIVTSYCPDGALAAQVVCSSSVPVKIFYDMDTPITLAALERGEVLPYLPSAGLGGFDLVLSYTGGAALAGLRERLGAKRVEPLYGWVDAAAFAPGRSSDTYRADLSYIGTYAADRQARVQTLFLEPARRAPSRRFVLAGAQYPADLVWSDNVHFMQHLPPSEHPAFYASSRMTLNVTRDAMARYGYCPSGRLFEASACGTTIISDYFIGIEEFFVPGEEVVIAETAEDVRGALERDDAEISGIAEAARVRVLREHLAEHRAARLLHLLKTR
jgi:spore maturation protein CgeB